MNKNRLERSEIDSPVPDLGCAMSFQMTEDPQIRTLAERGYDMIFTNVDSTYLDCGFGAWVGEGNNWCSPYKGAIEKENYRKRNYTT